MSTNPVIGGTPTIGVYATIDPRTYPVPGKESVRDQQAAMVRDRLEKVIDYIEGILKEHNIDGTVIRGQCFVGGPVEAATVRQQFESMGANIVVNSMATWSMGWETDVSVGHPEWLCAIEAMNGTAWPGAVLLHARRASATAHRRPVYPIYPPDVQADPTGDLHNETRERLRQFITAASAIVRMRGTSYASIGHVSMGIAGSENISDIFSRWFGMMLVHIDQMEIFNRIENKMFDPFERDHATGWFREKFAGRFDPDGLRNPDELHELIHKWLVPMTLVVRGIMRGDDGIADTERRQGVNALVGGTAGQRYWTDWFPNFDFTEAMLSGSFDWNGRREPITLATENDGLNGMGMLLGTLLTGRATLFADLRTYWSARAIREQTGHSLGGYCEGGFIHLINSGPAALDWATDPRSNNVMAEAIERTTWHPAELGYFPHDGLSTHFVTPGGVPVTLLRLNRVGLDLTLSVVHAHTVDLPPKVAAHVRRVTNPTWPDTIIRVDEGSTEDFMTNGNDPNHVVAVAGHIGGDVLTVASMLRIPVDYTNVATCLALRPTLWTRLGGDWQACRTLGPLSA